MQMSIVQKEPNINLVDGVGESIQWTIEANRLQERVPICDVIIIAAVKRVWCRSLLFVVVLLIKCINEYLPEHHTKCYWVNSVGLNQEFLTSQMRTRVNQTYGNHSCLGESIFHLQKKDTFTMELFVPEETRLSYSAYTNVSAFFIGDDHLIWVDHPTFFYFWIQQLYRKMERSFLAKTASEHLRKLHEIAKSYQYHSPNRHLRCRGFSPGFAILTYYFKLSRRFCTLLHYAPKSEILPPLNPEQELYTSMDRQEDAVIDISMVIFAEFVTDGLISNGGNVFLAKCSSLQSQVQGQPPAVRAAIGATEKKMRLAAFVLGQDNKTKIQKHILGDSRKAIFDGCAKRGGILSQEKPIKNMNRG